MQHYPVVIIGAGLTGLSCAHHLVRMGIVPLVLEKSERVGGSIQSVREDGFLYETGPNTGVISNVEIVELFDQLSAYCNPELADSSVAGKRYILKKGKWRALPSSLLSGIRTPLFTFSDKLRILAEPFKKKGNDPNENLAELVKRRLGQSFLDYAVDPFVGGIYSADPAQLIPKYALPKLYDLEQKYGSFIKGSIAKAKEKKHLSAMEKRISKSIFSVQGGLEALPQALLKSIGKENVLLNCNQLSIVPNENGYLINGDIQTKQIISCVGAHELPKLFSFMDEKLFANIVNLEQAKMTTVSMGFKHWEGEKLDGFGGLIPFKEHRNTLGILYLSSCFKGRAPEGGALLTAFIGGMRRPELFELSDEEIHGLVEKEMMDLFHLKSFQPDLFKIKRHRYAIPQYDSSSSARISAVEEIMKKYPGILLGGNMHQGIGIPDRVKQGFNLANLAKT